MIDDADFDKAHEIAKQIVAAWGLNDHETKQLLGKEDIQKVSYVLGIYKALRTIFPTEQQANAWPKKPNEAFGGCSAVEVMLSGGLARVRRYLDSQCLSESVSKYDQSS